MSIAERFHYWIESFLEFSRFSKRFYCFQCLAEWAEIFNHPIDIIFFCFSQFPIIAAKSFLIKGIWIRWGSFKVCGFLMELLLVRWSSKKVNFSDCKNTFLPSILILFCECNQNFLNVSDKIRSVIGYNPNTVHKISTIVHSLALTTEFKYSRMKLEESATDNPRPFASLCEFGSNRARRWGIFHSQLCCDWQRTYWVIIVGVIIRNQISLNPQLNEIFHLVSCA